MVRRWLHEYLDSSAVIMVAGLVIDSERRNFEFFPERRHPQRVAILILLPLLADSRVVCRRLVEFLIVLCVPLRLAGVALLPLSEVDWRPDRDLAIREIAHRSPNLISSRRVLQIVVRVCDFREKLEVQGVKNLY